MCAPILTFFNNKGGVGKTSLVYHLAWMFASLRKRVVAVDLDPQANLTAAFLDEEEIATLWNSSNKSATIYRSIQPITNVGDIAEPELQEIANDLYLLPGDVDLSKFEEALSNEWPISLSDHKLYRPMRILSSFWQVIQMASRKISADIVLVDVGPNMGAINRSALIATDYAIIPLGADLFSVQSLKNLGPVLANWKTSWQKRCANWRNSSENTEYPDFLLPTANMETIGYICQQYSVRNDRSIRACDKWLSRIPSVYRQYVLKESESPNLIPQEDPYCLARLKHFRSLIPMGQEHRKPIFNLTLADGAIGSHANAVRDAQKDFKTLAGKIAGKIGLSLDAST